jgi:serine/threonine protein kinase
MTARPSTHPDAQQLAAYGLGCLDEADAASVHDHLETCEECRAAVEALADDTLAALVRAAAGRVGSSAEAATVAPDSAPSPSPSGPTAETFAFLAPSQEPGEIGRLGPYRILKVLGAGGMGVVFQAKDPQLDRLVALKTLLPGLAAGPEARRRFEREARAAAALKHDHVVTIHQVGEDRGVPFLAMEFLEGEPLDERLKRQGRLPVGEVLRIGREIAEGLAAAHERGLIHRDIKPGNIWLETRPAGGQTFPSAGGQKADSKVCPTAATRVKILDFGLARPAADPAGVTQMGAILGTPAYMAPEQSRALGVDHRSDLFSLGCVLYRMCTGQLPFKGTDPISVVTALALDNPRPPREVFPEVPPALSDLVMRLLAKNPADRPASAAEVALALEAIMTRGDSGRACEVTRAAAPLAEQEADWVQPDQLLPVDSPRRRWRWWTAAAVLATLGVATVLFGPTVLRIVTNQGLLIIETEDADVEVKVSQDGQEVTILDLKSQKEVSLKAGMKYQLEVTKGKDGLTLSARELTLERGGRRIVRVRWEPAEPVGEIRRLGGHRFWVNSVAFSPDGKYSPPPPASGTGAARSGCGACRPSRNWPPWRNRAPTLPASRWRRTARRSPAAAGKTTPCCCGMWKPSNSDGS